MKAKRWSRQSLVLVGRRGGPHPRARDLLGDVEAAGPRRWSRKSVLIDTGFPETATRSDPPRRDASRRLTRIDHVVVTQFHVEHFGGLASLRA